MSIYINCSRCKEKNAIRSNASNRSNLERAKGELIKLQYKGCRENREYHVNEFRSDINPYVTGAGVAIGLIITIILWYILGVVGTISMTIPILILHQQRSSVTAFNKYKIKEMKTTQEGKFIKTRFIEL